MVINFGTVAIASTAPFLAVMLRGVFRRHSKRKDYRALDLIFLGAIAVRLAFLVGCLLLYGGELPSFVYDDQTYYQYAAGYISESDLYELGFYHVFLKGLYDVFGISSINGRLLNILLASATVYSVGYIEEHLSGEESLLATKLYAFMPYMFFSSCFELKDIFALFLYITIYALLLGFSEHADKALLFIAIPLMIVAELVRSLAGVLPAMLFLYASFNRHSNMSRVERGIIGAVIVIPLALMALLIFPSTWQGYITTLNQYQRWISTQFSATSFYNFFLLRTPIDVWKIPFSIALYLLQPFSFLDGSGRVFFELGGILKIIDIPVVCLSIVWLPRYISREGARSLMLLIPLAFLACVNLTNAREVIYIYPFIYLIFSMGWSQTGERAAETMPRCRRLVLNKTQIVSIMALLLIAAANIQSLRFIGLIG